MRRASRLAVARIGAALFVEDNGHPVAGEPADCALAVLLRVSTKDLACATGVAPLATVPIEHGNYVVSDDVP